RLPRRQAVRLGVADDADYFPPLAAVGALAETFANRVLAWPELFGHRAVDQHGPRVLAVARIEKTSFDERDAERLEVGAVVPAVLDERRILWIPGQVPLDLHLAVPAEVVHRQMADEPDVLDAADLR